MVKQRSEFQKSWMDGFFDWVEQLPIPYWLFYVSLYVISLLIHHILAWKSGNLETYVISMNFIMHNIWLILLAGPAHSVRRGRQRAIERFRPALHMNDARFRNIKERFVYLSRGLGFLALLFVPLNVFLIPILHSGFLGEVFFSPSNYWFTVTLILLSAPMNATFFYSAFISLVRIGKMYQLIQQINLFALNPLYAFSDFTSRLGIFLLLIGFGSAFFPIVDPQNRSGGVAYVYAGLYVLLGILVFIWPLMGIHSRLVVKKENELTRIGNRLNRAFSNLHRAEQGGKPSEVNNIRQLIDTTMREREYIASVSTWPWNTETLHTFLAALFLPLAVWIIQQILSRTLS